MTARWLTPVRVFLVVLLGFTLLAVILLLGHELFLMFLVNTLQAGRYAVRPANDLYYVISGVVCLAYIFLVHDYINRKAKKGRLLEKSLLTLGIQVLLVGLIHLGLLLYGYFARGVLVIFLVVMEGLVGAILLYFGFLMNKRWSLSIK